MARTTVNIGALASNDERGKVALLSAKIDDHSPAWADIVKPFAIGIFIFVGLLMVLPFVWLIVWPGNDRLHFHAATIDWAKTILAPITGLASAVVGYYFGTSSAPKGTESNKN